MKVQFLTLSVSRKAGGIYFSVRSLAYNLQNYGAICRVLGPRDEFTAEDIDNWSPLEVEIYDVVGPKSFGYSNKITGLLGKPDIQHIHGIWMYSSFVNHRAAANNAVPYIISPHGMLDPWALNNSRWKKWLVGWLYENRHLRGADCIHALCDAEANSIREFGLKNPICVIPNGVDLPDLDEAQPFMLEYTSGCKKQLLFIGRIHPKKGLINLINAFSKINTELRNDWELVIAGWDQNHQHDLKALAQELGVSDSVKFPGPQFGERKEDLLRKSSAFVLPSFSEGLPMSVLEAWSYGLPSLITNACNLPEGQQYEASIECEPSEESIQQGLVKLLTMNDAQIDKMGSRARALVREKFSWPVVSSRMNDVYRWLRGEIEAPSTVRFY